MGCLGVLWWLRPVCPAVLSGSVSPEGPQWAALRPYALNGPLIAHRTLAARSESGNVRVLSGGQSGNGAGLVTLCLSH